MSDIAATASTAPRFGPESLSRPNRWGRPAVMLLIFAISLSPRMPLDIAIPGRTFDLRVEDLLLMAFLGAWFLARPRAYLTPLIKPIGLYVAICVMTTIVALFYAETNVLRSVLYLLKEIEFIALFLFVANWTKSERDLRSAILAFLCAGAINIAWIAFQIKTGDFRSLFVVSGELPSDVYIGGSRYESYGPHLLGESSPLSTGGFMMLVFLTSFAYSLYSRPCISRRVIGILAAAAMVGVIASFSRSSMIGAILGAFVIMGARPPAIRRKIFWTMIALPALLIWLARFKFFVSTIYTEGVMVDRFSTQGIWRAVDERIFQFWRPLLYHSLDRIITGFGKGATAFLPIFPADPHNHYIRILIETGVFGLLAFIWLLLRIVRLCASTAKAARSFFVQVVSLAALGGTCALIVEAFFEDAFMPVLLNETWWILIGLTVAGRRIELKRQNVSGNAHVRSSGSA